MKTKKKLLKFFVKENTWLSGVSHGWGNGYVVVPKGHKYHGVGYDNIPVDVHGGLTFAENASEIDWPEIPRGCKSGWIVGFDTAHYNDSQNKWTQSMVIKETENLAKQLSK